MEGARVRSLVEELRSRVPPGEAKKKKKSYFLQTIFQSLVCAYFKNFSLLLGLGGVGGVAFVYHSLNSYQSKPNKKVVSDFQVFLPRGEIFLRLPSYEAFNQLLS